MKFCILNLLIKKGTIRSKAQVTYTFRKVSLRYILFYFIENQQLFEDTENSNII